MPDTEKKSYDKMNWKDLPSEAKAAAAELQQQAAAEAEGNQRAERRPHSRDQRPFPHAAKQDTRGEGERDAAAAQQGRHPSAP